MTDLNRDIQASHRILKILQSSNHLVEDILDQIPGLFILADIHGRILRANPNACECFNTDIDQMPKANIDDLLGEMIEWKRFNSSDHETIHEAHFSGMLTSGLASGRTFLWFLKRFKDKNNHTLVLVLAEEITQIQEFQKRLLRIYHSTPIGICVVNRLGEIVSGFSKFLETILGTSDLLGKQLFPLLWGERAQISQEERARITDILLNLGQKTNLIEEKIRLIPQLFQFQSTQDQRPRWYKCSIKPVDEDGKCTELLILLEDQTEWIQIEQKNRDMETQSHALYEMAIKDALTGLYNRHYLEDGIKQMIANYHRGKMDAISLVMVDVDHFKKINDTYGHSIGDIVLRNLGQSILKTQRSSDVAIRFGGEEFAIFLTTQGVLALNFAERLRKQIEATVIDFENIHLKYTISLGVAELSQGEDIHSLFTRADEALYLSKRNGRNRINICK